jgi:hypothetical protein
MWKQLTGTVAAVVLIGGCSGEESTPSQASPGIHLHRIETFVTVKELADASELVVEATLIPGKLEIEPVVGEVDSLAGGTSPGADEESGRGKGGQESTKPGFSVVEMKVSKVLKGESGTATSITVRALSGTQDFKEWKEGAQYLLYLKQFEWEPGKPTGEYTPVGVFAGIFEVSDGVVRRQDEGSPDIPLIQDLPEVESESDAAEQG